MIVSTFSMPSLDKLTIRSDDLTTLRALRAAGKFSCWEIDDERKLHGKMNRLRIAGFITLRHTRTVAGEANEPDRLVDAYPWTFVTVTPLGEQYLAAVTTKNPTP